MSQAAKQSHSLTTDQGTSDYPTVDHLEVAFLVVFGVLVSTSWISFTLAEVGLDRPFFVLCLGVVGLVCVGVVTIRTRWKPVSSGALIGLLIPLALGVVLFFPADEWIIGGLDPGSYVNAGAAIARTGGIVLASPEVAALDPRVHDALFLGDGNRLPGFYLVFARFAGLIPSGFVVSSDRVVPHGLHLYPVVLSFGYSVGGISAELAVTPLLALGGIAAFYLLIRRLFGTLVGTLAASILAISPAEVWFARYPAAEILAQLLLFSGLLAIVIWLEHPHWVLAVFAGLAMGEIHLTKIELVTLPLLVAGFCAYEAIVRGFDRRWWWFVVTYLVIIVQSVLHMLLIAYWYASTAASYVTPGRQTVLALAIVLTLSTVLTAATLTTGLRPRIAKILVDPRWEPLASVVVPAAIGCLAAYGYFVRPLAVGAALALPAAAQANVINNLLSFQRLGWYVTPVGLLLGVVGWMMIGVSERRRSAVLPLVIIAVDCLLFLSDMRITPVHYWAARRWVSLVIPGFCLAAAYALAKLLPTKRADWVRAIVPVAFFVALVGQMGIADRPLIGYVEYRGATAQLEKLASVFPKDSAILFADGDSGKRLSVPLQYLFERNSFIVPTDPDVDAAIARATDGWLSRGVPVYWVTTPDLPTPQEIGKTGTVVARQHLDLPEKLSTRDVAPGANGSFQQDLIVWRLDP